MNVPAAPPERILFVELLGGIGDLLIALPAIEALARSRPGAHLDVLTFEPGAGLLGGHPAEGRVWPPEELLDRRDARGAAERLLREERYDLVVSDTRYDGIGALIETHAARAVTDLWRGPPRNQRVSDRFLEVLVDEGLVDPATIAPPRLELDDAPTGTELGDGDGGPIVFLVPEAGERLKRWPLERFAEVGRDLGKRHQVRVLVPTGGDPQLSHQLADAVGDAARSLPPTPLDGLAAWFRRGDLAITADTGPAHLAAAVGLPTVTVFGPTWHQRYRPAGPNRSLQGYLHCPERIVENFTVQRCWSDGHCPYSWQTCTEDITVAEVVEAASELLSARQPA